MTDQDKILSLLRMHGPSLPFKVAKALNTEILFASAHLADLTAQGKVKISNLKVGGSPLYYVPGQEHQLYNFASGNLNPKDCAVLNKLKEQKILREGGLELLEKVALRNLKDFAIPLQVTVEGKAELFWKWHLLLEQETNETIERVLGIGTAASPPLAVPAELKPESAVVAPAASSMFVPPPPTLLHSAPPVPHSFTTPSSAVSPPPVAAASPMIKDERVVETLGRQERPLKPARISAKRPKPEDDDFFPSLERLFRRLSITIEQKETVRKAKELNFLLKVPSAVGPMSYFCKAKNKSRCDEKDLSAAYLEAQVKKLPLLFLHTGELSKKALEMLKSGVMENVMVRKVE